MARIRSLRPSVTQEEALRQLSFGGPLRYLNNAAFGPLRAVAEFYIPFRVFQVEILNRSSRDQSILGLDAVNGSLDLYGFEGLPGSQDVIYLETRNCADPLLDEAEANELLMTRVQRLLFATGFFRVRSLQISAKAIPGEIHIPYWVGFRGRGTRPRLVAMDAVRRCREGAKVRTLLRDWLTSVREIAD